MLALFQIIADIRSFLFILLLVMLAFGNMFFLIAADHVDVEASRRMLHGGGSSSESADANGASAPLLTAAAGAGSGMAADEREGGGANDAFGSPGEAFISVFRMMIGDFEREWFFEPFTLVLFLTYMFVVMILMLNVLIAVVSDSYDFAVIKSVTLFRRARLDLAAEFEAMLDLCGADRERPHDQTYRALLDDNEHDGAATKRTLGSVWALLQTMIRMRGHEPAPSGDDDSEDDWLGRALDTERRVRILLDASERRICEKLIAHIDTALAERQGVSKRSAGVAARE